MLRYIHRSAMLFGFSHQFGDCHAHTPTPQYQYSEWGKVVLVQYWSRISKFEDSCRKYLIHYIVQTNMPKQLLQHLLSFLIGFLSFCLFRECTDFHLHHERALTCYDFFAPFKKGIESSLERRFSKTVHDGSLTKGAVYKLYQ
jgi:hypothetical protein